VEVTEWEFEHTPLSPGAVILVDKDGNVTVDDEPSDIVVDSDGESYNYGDVEIKIEQDEEGNLILTEFTTTNTSFAILGSIIYLPTSVNIDGEIYPVTGVAAPLDINISDPLIGSFLYNNNVYIPEGYTYLCDDAFATLHKKTIFHIPSTMQSIGHGVFMPDRNVTQTIEFNGNQTAWNSISKTLGWENGQGNISINYLT